MTGTWPEPLVRPAFRDDVPDICRFGDEHVAAHYTPLIGVDAAAGQVRDWWNGDQVATAVEQDLVVIAESRGRVVGVAQRGLHGGDHVVYKLYVHPDLRGRGVGRHLLDALERQLPPDTERLYIEHFAANERAGQFYAREGFTVDRVEPSATGDPRLAVVWRVGAVRV